MDKKTTSLAKIGANKKNAQKSTGPKTDEGKIAVRMNALKHGLLSKELIIQQGDGKEDENEYTVLLQDLCCDLSPEGSIEQMLVERIAACYWRLRRSAKFEVGVLRDKLDRANSKYKPFITIDGEKVNLLTEFDRLIKEEKECIKWSKRRIKLLKHGLALDREPEDECPVFLMIYYENLISLKYITDEVNDPDLDIAKFDEDEMTLEEMREFLLKKGWSDETLRESFIDQDLELINDSKKLLEKLERMKRNADLKASRLIQSKSLPDAPEMDRILRYETAIERQLYRALNQLERFQRMRTGDNVPPLISVEVNTENS
jgi:hypothetical protein